MELCTITSFLTLALIAGQGVKPPPPGPGNPPVIKHSSGSFQVAGYVTDTAGNPIVGIDVIGDDYVGDFYIFKTDDFGYYSVDFDSDGNYRVTVSCPQLTERGYLCPPPRAVTIAGEAVQENFVVQAGGGLRITSATLPKGHVGVAYNAHLGALGGSPPYSWQLASGSTNLPPGLLLSSNGVVSGTPTAIAACSVNVQVTDAQAVVTNRMVSVTINPRPVLSAPTWLTNRFVMHLTGVSNQNYTIQVSTNLSSTNWMSLLITNHPAASSFTVTDPWATNRARFYRVLVGP